MILEVIRKAIQKSKHSRYRISKDAGVDETVIHRIVHGGGCSIQTADKLCDYLGLKLATTKK